jgi:hypothetical protein
VGAIGNCLNDSAYFKIATATNIPEIKEFIRGLALAKAD